MKKTRPYKGYTATLDEPDESGVVSGAVIGYKDTICFEAGDFDAVERTFHEAVDDYLAWCKESGRTPDKQVSGRISVRVSPELHREVFRRATQSGTSISGLVVTAIEAYLRQFRRERMDKILEALADQPVLDDRTADEILGYDEYGLPQ